MAIISIVDCHSHIGIDYSWRKATFDGYLELLEKTGIDMALLMAVPNQIDIKTNKRLLVWEISKGDVEYYNEVNNIKPTSKLFNDPIREIVTDYDGDKKLYFIPIIHPRLDDSTYLYELMDKDNPVAFKIHGVAHGVYPEMIDSEFIRALQNINIPIIVHTDFSLETNSIKGFIKAQNSSLKWARFFIENSIKGYITHAARLDNETIKLINENDNLVLGIGPDLLLSEYSSGLKDIGQYTKKDLLKILRDIVDPDKILFDVDYSWNVIGKERNLDYEMVKRVDSVFPENDKTKVLERNATRFFRLENRK